MQVFLFLNDVLQKLMFLADFQVATASLHVKLIPLMHKNFTTEAVYSDYCYYYYIFVYTFAMYCACVTINSLFARDRHVLMLLGDTEAKKTRIQRAREKSWLLETMAALHSSTSPVKGKTGSATKVPAFTVQAGMKNTQVCLV